MNILTWLTTTTIGQQVSRSFDKATLEKITKGAVFSGINAGLIAMLVYLQGIEIADPALAGFMTWAIPTAINAVKEWYKGVAR
jgi:hypothetical protein